MPPSTASKRLLSRKQVLETVGLSYPTLWRMMRECQFPRSVVIGSNRVAWYAAEVDEWLGSRPRRRLKGDPADDDAAS